MDSLTKMLKRVTPALGSVFKPQLDLDGSIQALYGCLVEVEQIARVSARLLVNRAALKTRSQEMAGWIDRFREAADAA